MQEMLIANDILFLTVSLLSIALATAKDCWFTNNGRIRQFYCAEYQSCCADHCCQMSSKFYQLWYFWMCVVILLVIFAVGIYLVQRWYKFRGILPGATCNRRNQRNTISFVPTSTTSLPPPYNATNPLACPFLITPPPYNSTEAMEPPSYNSLFVTKLEKEQEGLLSSGIKD
ncbi:hypothetical protein ScPMuIL_015288 [Solemya velum]